MFYENVERGHFISMIYGVFDLDTKTFTFARAGHNPVISHKTLEATTEILCPPGMALGLESGKLFAATIEEMQVSIAEDDTFVFYTDGFSEAMNSLQEEFGEDRLEETITLSKQVTANALLTRIKDSVEAFTSNSVQHDDMTMVVVKILGD